MKLYRFLYYRLYNWNLKTWGKKDLPQWNALFGVSFMMFVNLGIIAGILDILGLKIFVEDTPKKEIAFALLALLTANYFWLVHNGKYKQIAKEFNKEPKDKRTRNIILLWLYVVASFFVVSIIAILSGKLKGLQ